VALLFRCDETFHLQVRQMVTNGDGVDAHRFSQFIDRDLWLAEQGLQDLVFHAFHEKEYNSPLLSCQYNR
jgi:hypothetical protein